jgi:tetratricopeptide (TPR) repeat protein
MSEAEVDQLDPAALDDSRLADAFESAAGLRDDRRTARFAAELARRNPPTLSRLDLAAPFAPLVREAMSAGESEQAIAWLDRAREIDEGHGRRTFDIWRAEVQARSGDPDSALKTYQALLEQTPTDVALALDAAETLLDQGYEEHARPLFLHARDQARRSGDSRTAERAENILDHVLS